MKTIILTSLLMCLGSLSFAQQKQTSPPASTTSSSVSTFSSTNINYEHSVSNNEGNGDENLSIAISELDDSYKLRAKFPITNDRAIKELLINEFGSKNLQSDGKDWMWTSASTSSEIYKIKFSSGKLRMDLDKEQAADPITEKFIRTGQEIKDLLSGENDIRTDALNLQAEEIHSDSQRMQRRGEHLEKRKEQELPDNDVKALKLKAEKLQQKVDSLQKELKDNKVD